MVRGSEISERPTPSNGVGPENPVPAPTPFRHPHEVTPHFVVAPLTTEHALSITTWRYAGKWSVYDSRPEEGPYEAEEGYAAVLDGDTLAGFLCVGAEARVPGLTEESGVVDLGVGMNPALVGQGHGRRFGTAVLDHLRATGTDRVRIVVQSWNTRSLRLAARIGFTETGRHHADVEYVVLHADLRSGEGGDGLHRAVQLVRGDEVVR